MTRFVIAAAATLVFASAASATNSNVYVDGSSVHVRYGDLDLRSAAGRSQLKRRIHDGADLLCAKSADDSMPYGLSRNQCLRAVVADGGEQMHKIVRR